MRAAGIALLVITVLLIDAPAAEAQLAGYAIAGPAGFSGFFGSSHDGVHAAAGAELLAGSRAGAAAEFGILGGGGAPLFVLSVNGVVHPLSTKRRASPFLTGGYTRMFNQDGSFDAWNAGAGTDFRWRGRAGFRIEFRDHVRLDSRGTVHYWALRAGVVVR